MTDAILKFIADGDLKPLAKRIRMLGIDCGYKGGTSIADMIQTALLEDRILITLKAVPDTARLKVLTLDSDDPEKQLRSVAEAFPFSDHSQPVSRRLVCNALLEDLQPSGDDEEIDIPASVRQRGLPLFQCPQCRRPYWHGSHIKRMREMLERSDIGLGGTAVQDIIY